MKKSQKQRILETFQEAEGTKISTRYFKQELLISEANGRISELRNDGWNIETLKEKDDYGFFYHRLIEEPQQLKI